MLEIERPMYEMEYFMFKIRRPILKMEGLHVGDGKAYVVDRFLLG